MRDNPIDDQSYTYNILSYLSISGDWWYASLLTNGSDNTVGGSYYSAHQAVGKFAEHHIDMVSCVHRKCQTRAGVSGDIITVRLTVKYKYMKHNSNT